MFTKLTGIYFPIGRGHLSTASEKVALKVVLGILSLGTDKYGSEKEYHSRLESLGGVIDTRVDMDYSLLYVRCPSEFVSESTKLLSELIEDLSERNFDKARSAYRDELNAVVDVPIRKLYNNTTMSIIAQPTLGELLVALDELTFDIVRGLFERLKDCMETFEYDGTTGPILSLTRSVSTSDIMNGNRVELDQADTAQGAVAYGYYHFDGAMHMAKLMEGIYSTGMAGPVFEIIRKREGMAYFARMMSETYGRYDVHIMAAAVNAENIEKTLEIMDEIYQGTTLEVVQDNIERAANYYVGSLKRRYDEIQSRFSMQLESYIQYGEVYTIEESVEQVSEITPEMLHLYISKTIENPRIVAATGQIPDDAVNNIKSTYNA